MNRHLSLITLESTINSINKINKFRSFDNKIFQNLTINRQNNSYIFKMAGSTFRTLGSYVPFRNLERTCTNKFRRKIVSKNTG
jgi:hypothetical protein